MRITVTGDKALADALRKASAKVRDMVDEEVGDVAAELEADIVLAIQRGPKTGRVYQRGDVVHQASKAGEAPASDTGNLIISIYSEKVRDMTWTVGSRAPYAAHLEFGTSRMASRPYFRPQIERVRPEFSARIREIIKRATT